MRTDETKNMSAMFFGCKALKEINLVNFNTRKITEMINKFY